MINPRARQAALIAFGKMAAERLDAGLCPLCGKQPDEFRDRRSKAEFLMTGLCQACQDIVFKEES